MAIFWVGWHCLSNHTREGVADGIKKAIIFSEQQIFTLGRNRIIKLGLEKNVTAKKLNKIYLNTIDLN